MAMDTRTLEMTSKALATLAEALEQGNSHALKTYLTVMGRFHSYSWTNSLLIALQRPNATQVAGFHSWLKLGRHVRKGEKGISILAPILCKVSPEGIEPEKASPTKQEPKTRLTGFRVAYVFDLQQTEGQDLPQFATVQGNPKASKEALIQFACSCGIAIDFDVAISPARGVSHGGRITLMPNLLPAEEFSTLVHEVAHEFLHRGDRRLQTTKTMRETEAEAVAFVVCEAIGLDTNTASVDYIKLYNGDSSTLSASLHLIQSTAAKILSAIDASGTFQERSAEA